MHFVLRVAPLELLVVIIIIDIEFTIQRSFIEFTIQRSSIEFTIQRSSIEFTIQRSFIEFTIQRSLHILEVPL